jgi:precorrin-8X/cobalt-precorrin-8 methylmutase
MQSYQRELPSGSGTGTQAGFVHDAKSKEDIRSIIIPSISNEDTRNVTLITVASLNEIITTLG